MKKQTFDEWVIEQDDKEIEKWRNAYFELQNRINKAIEYIKKLDSETTDMYEICETCKNKLLDILNELGGKNENISSL